MSYYYYSVSLVCRRYYNTVCGDVMGLKSYINV